MSYRLWLAVIAASGILSACGSGGEESSASSTSSASSVSSVSSVSSSSSEAPSSSSTASSVVSVGDPSSLHINEIVADNELPFMEGNDWIELYNAGDGAVNLADFTLADSNAEPAALPDLTLQAGEYFVIAAADVEEPPTDGSPFVPFKLGAEDSVTLAQGGETIDTLSWVDGDAKGGRSYGHFEGALQTIYPTPGYDNAPYELFAENKVFKVEIQMSAEDWQAFLAEAQQEVWYPVDMVFNGIKMDNVGFRTKGQSSLSMMSAIPEGHPSKNRYGFKIDFNRYEEKKFMGMKMLVLGNGFADPSMMRDVVSYQLFKDAGVPSPRTSFVDLYVAGEHLGLYSLIEAIDGEFVERYFEDDNENDLKGDLYKAEVGNALTWSGDDISAYSGLELKTNEETLGTPEEGDALLRFLDTLNNSTTPLAHVDTDLNLRYFAALALTGNTDSYLSFSANNFYLYEHRSIDAFAMLPWDFNLGLGVVGSVLEDPGVSDLSDFIIGPQEGFTGGGFGDFGGGGAFDDIDFENIDFGDIDFGDIDFGDGGGGGGGFSFGPQCDTVEHLIDTPINSSDARPLATALLEDPQLLAQYRQHIQDLVDGPFSPENVRAEVMRMADLIDPYVQNDPTKFFTYTEWRHSLTNDMPADSNIQGGRGGDFFGPAVGLLRFIDDRIANVQQQLSGAIPSSSASGIACPD